MPLATTGAGQSKGGPSFPVEINFDGDEATYFDGGWSEVGGNVLNDQIVLGSELAANNDFSADSDWAKGTGWTIGGGVATKAAGAASNLTQAVTSATEWFKVTWKLASQSAGSLRAMFGTTGFGLGPIQTVPATYNHTQRGAGADGGLRSNSDFAGTADDVFIKQLTLTSLLNALKSQFGLADGFFIDLSINAVTAGNQVGIIWNLDNPISPTNFAVAYMDGVSLAVDKNVSGTYTNLSDVAQAVTQDQILRIENPAGSNVLSIKYNGVSKATPTISDASILGNIGMALFSTEANNAISKVVIGKL